MGLRKTILVVDDSASVRMLQEILLRRGAYDVLTASDGAQALSMAISHRPDLILMDVEMPRMNGIQACRAIRASPQGRDVPIIIVTTHSDKSTMDAALKSNCTDFVHKPIDATELLSKIKSHLGG
jgi:two-component system, OmpR family, alkaline phosphatase synthesis response regulator PhoP